MTNQKRIFLRQEDVRRATDKLVSVNEGDWILASVGFFLIMNAVVTFYLFWTISKSNAIIALLSISAKVQSTTSTTTEESMILFFHTPASTEQSTIRETTTSDTFEWLWKLTNFEIAILLLFLEFGITVNLRNHETMPEIRCDPRRHTSGTESHKWTAVSVCEIVPTGRNANRLQTRDYQRNPGCPGRKEMLRMRMGSEIQLARKHRRAV